MIDLKLLNPLIRQISEERGLPEEQILEAIEAALAAAYKKEYGKKSQIIKAKIDPQTGATQFWQVKIAVDPNEIFTPEEVQEATFDKNENKKILFNPEKHLLLEEAQKINPKIQAGEELLFPLEVKEDFSRIAAQTAKQVILQKFHELEKQAILSEFKEKEGKVVSGLIQRIEKKVIYVDLGKTFGVLFPNEGIPGEHYQVGERKKFYVLRLEDKGQGPAIILSRAHPKFVSKLFEMEVPEIAEGVVEIKSISREPGNRTKIAVSSNDENIDPVGSCVGQKGTRVATIIDELNGERIDIIPYSEEPAKYVAAALGPAQVKETEVIPERREVKVFIPPDQISLAIGKNGQNVRLAAKLTGWKIDVRSAVAPEEEIAGGVAEANEEKEDLKE
ncbi:MAG: transcription termination/antitermination protein NusA [Patescibacteria group bacterium]|nr:transcription termination/antitermination protein NusA [Patescibacteria group bacterium]